MSHSLYKTARWRKLRGRKLARDPYCQCPHHNGKGTRANVVDHIVPHRGDKRLFFSWSNLQSMATDCHNRFKQSQEKGGAGFDAGCNVKGEPLNKEHHWYGQQ